MIRSYWICSAVLMLTAAGLVNGQDAGKDRLLSVQEIGRPPLECRLLKSWHEPDGVKVYQIQEVRTGEMITIIESGPVNVPSPPGSTGKAVASRIVHWGSANHPPAGTPEAPAHAIVYGQPSPLPMTSVSPQPSKVIEPVKPYTAKNPSGVWPEAYAREAPTQSKLTSPLVVAPPVLPQPTQVPTEIIKKPASTIITPAPVIVAQTPANVPIFPTPEATPPAPAVKTPAPAIVPPAPTPTIVPPAPVVKVPAPAVVPPLVQTPAPVSPAPVSMPTPVRVQAPANVPTTSSAVMNWSNQSMPGSPSPYAPVNVTPKPTVIPLVNVVQPQKKNDQTSVSTLPPNAILAQKTNQTPTTSAQTTSKSTAPPKSTVIDDWHNSWSKVQQPKSTLTASAAPPSPTPPSLWPKSTMVATRKIDPLQDPENYTKRPAEDAFDSKPVETVAKDKGKTATPVSAKSSTTATTASTTPSSSQAIQAAKTTVQSKPAPLPLPAVPEPPLLIGSTASPKPELASMPSKVATPSSPAAAAPPTILPPPPALSVPAFPSSNVNPTPINHSPVSNSTPTIPAVPQQVVPPGIAAAAMAAADNGGNAFSTPRPAPQSTANNMPMATMPRYVPETRQDVAANTNTNNAFMTIPAPPPNTQANANASNAFRTIPVPPSPNVVTNTYPVATTSVVTKELPMPAMQYQAVPMGTGTNLSDLLTTLRTSLYPSQREWAADRLTTQDWRTNPEVINGLVTAAHTDPAPLVRAGCLRALAHMRATCDPAIATARELKKDTDARVRQEAENAYGILQAARTVRVE